MVRCNCLRTVNLLILSIRRRSDKTSRARRAFLADDPAITSVSPEAFLSIVPPSPLQTLFRPAIHNKERPYHNRSTFENGPVSCEFNCCEAVRWPLDRHVLFHPRGQHLHIRRQGQSLLFFPPSLSQPVPQRLSPAGPLDLLILVLDLLAGQGTRRGRTGQEGAQFAIFFKPMTNFRGPASEQVESPLGLM